MPRLVKQRSNFCYINPADAREAGLADGDLATVASDYDSITLPVKVTDEMMPRTIAIPQCWLSGMSHLSGILVTVSPAG